MNENLADLIGETETAVAEGPKLYRFRCISPGVSPNAPLFVTEQFWEAEEMKRNPEYIAVDADGVAIPDEAAAAATRIPFAPPSAPKQRKILTVAKRKA